MSAHTGCPKPRQQSVVRGAGGAQHFTPSDNSLVIHSFCLSLSRPLEHRGACRGALPTGCSCWHAFACKRLLPGNIAIYNLLALVSALASAPPSDASRSPCRCAASSCCTSMRSHSALPCMAAIFVPLNRDSQGVWHHAARITRPRGLLPAHSARQYQSAGAFTLLPPAARAAASDAAAAARQRLRGTADSNKSVWAALEARIVTVVSSLSFSTASQAVLAAFVPVTLAALLFPNRMRAYAYEVPSGGLKQQHGSTWTPPAAAVKGQLKSPHSSLWHALSSLADELALAARGLYLLALFSPVVLGAPLAFYFGIGRERWTQLLVWTLEHAGVSGVWGCMGFSGVRAAAVSVSV